MSDREQDINNAFDLGRHKEQHAICDWLTDMVARDHFSDDERRMVTAIVSNIRKDFHRRYESGRSGSDDNG